MNFDLKNTPKAKLIKIGIFAVIVIGLSLTLYFMGVKSGKAKAKVSAVSTGVNNTNVTVDLLESSVRAASDLVTTKYHYKDVMTVTRGEEKSILGVTYGTEEKLVTYAGIISVGFDVKEIEITIDDEKNTITLKLPEPKIISHEIIDDEFKVYDTDKSMFVDINTEDIIQDREQAKQDQQETLLKDPEFMESVDKNTKTVLREFLGGIIGDKGYEIVFDE